MESVVLEKQVGSRLLFVNSDEGNLPGPAIIRRGRPFLFHFPAIERCPRDAIKRCAFLGFDFAAKNHRVAHQLAAEMQDCAVAADPVLMPFMIGGIVIIDAHAGGAACRFPLLPNSAALGGAADFARAGLFSCLRVCDLPFA